MSANLGVFRQRLLVRATAHVLTVVLTFLSGAPALSQDLPPIFGDDGVIPDPAAPPDCNDGQDNDGDGRVDMDDPGCSSPDDNDEYNAPLACGDGVDNDGDGLVDMSDPGCSSDIDDSEDNPPPPQCSDGQDNDGDGLVDMDDPGCDGPDDFNEIGPFQCEDGLDNDGDGRVDGGDPGCSGPSDDDETDPPQCDDGRDNDGDGKIDLDDPGCSNLTDDDETDPGGPRQCQDGFDNDGDGLVDMDDPGCERATDHNETDPPPKACEDGIDNDNDGRVDLDDPGCDEAKDGDETDPPTTQCNDGVDNDGDGRVDMADPGCKSGRDNNETDPGSRGGAGTGGYGNSSEEQKQWAIQQGKMQSSESRQNYKFPTMAGNNITFGDGTTWNTDEINQYNNGEEDGKRYYPDGYEPPENESMWQQEQANEDRANAQKRMYNDDINSGSPSTMGVVYDMAVQDVQFQRPDMRNDPMVTASRNRMQNNQNTFEDYFGDCESERTATRTSKQHHLSDYRQCNRVLIDRSRRQCDISHNYGARFITVTSGPANVASCGEGCALLWLGRIGDNYWEANCSYFDQQITVQMESPHAVQSAVLEYVKYDDFIDVTISDQLIFRGPWGGDDPEPWAKTGECELNTEWESWPNADVTSHFRNVPANTNLTLRNLVMVGGKGEGYSRIRIHYDPQATIYDAGYSPSECTEAVQAINDGRAEGSYSCTQMPPLDANSCTFKNGVTICPHRVTRLAHDVAPLCERIYVDAQIKVNKGQMDCYQDMNGNQQCKYNNADRNDCEEYETNPSCAFIKQECMEDGYNENGECMVASETWDCGYSVEVEDTEMTSSYQCDGPVRCMGEECTEASGESSGSFNKAVAALQVAQMIQADAVCTTGDISQDNACKMFAGEPGECKMAVGGTADCCENPETISWVDYMKLMSSLYKIDGMIGSIMGVDSMTASAYAAMPGSGAITSAAKNAVRPFTNAYDAARDWFQDTVEKALEELLAQAKQWVKEQFGDQAANYATSEAATSGGSGYAADKVAQEGMMKQAMGAANFVMTAYSIYVATVIAIQMIYECEEEEFMMNSKKAVRACHYVGSYCRKDSFAGCIEERRTYCCFNSPLGRILQQQIRPQFGMSWGSPKYPDCGGIPAQDLARVDWSRVDLSEWIAMMAASGVMPDPNDMDMDFITGDGHSANVQSENRNNTQERMDNRMEDVDDSERRREAYKDTEYNTTGE